MVIGPRSLEISFSASKGTLNMSLKRIDRIVFVISENIPRREKR